MKQLTSSPVIERPPPASPSPPPTSTEFDRSLELAPDGDDRFRLELPAIWSSLVGIHGGFLTAVATRAAATAAPDRSVRTITSNFVRRARPGAAEVAVRTVRAGRSLHVLAVEIRQEGAAIVSSRVTTVDPGVVAGSEEWTPREPIPLPPPDRCVVIDPRRPVSHFDRAEALIDPSSVPFTAGQRAMVRGYLRPLEPRPIDAEWLAMASDWFPPPAFVRLDPPTGGISIDLTTHVHRTLRRLEDDWLAVAFEITDSAGGMATEHGRIATLDGTLLAESVQTRWMVRK